MRASHTRLQLMEETGTSWGQVIPPKTSTQTKAQECSGASVCSTDHCRRSQWIPLTYVNILLGSDVVTAEAQKVWMEREGW